MNSEEALKIYDCLSNSGKDGTPFLTIARETDIPGHKLKKYLNRFSKSFVRIGTSSNYTINSFNLIKDHKKYLIEEIDNYSRENNNKLAGTYIVIFSAIFVSIVAAISNNF